ncbi:hypothetical protein Ga0466249_000621 [Sporomusaceae bacterium BoRhaA]|uniref:hypothetical protein n=1 Tax=Pelorhabdus rhamnosifermentans TaxID=2772457 RepID=UPI001C05FE31|nr:hypothetical protein [Pelorhabdus rhamnosifermentans]MBU2699542.1 hypothetical protein [Pelorhabdus rhamnosifermentans]
MNYYLVLGATNEVMEHAQLYSDENLANKATLCFAGSESTSLAAGVIAHSKDAGVSRRALYLSLNIEAASLGPHSDIYVLVRSVPYLHSTTGARVFYNEQEAQAEVDNFNSAVSRANFHAYLFTFTL